MAQAFVRKVFITERTESTIQVPAEQSSLDEEGTKDIILKNAKDFVEKHSSDITDTSEKAFKMATTLNQALAKHVKDYCFETLGFPGLLIVRDSIRSSGTGSRWCCGASAGLSARGLTPLLKDNLKS